MDAYNPSLDTVSDGALQAKAWEQYKTNGTAGGPDDASHGNETLEDELIEEKKKEYGKHYPSVWTKEPHGGEYRIDKGPDVRRGYDALEQHSDGTMIARAPGYEKPQSGPTTNFVGNHMTQGAIDLVRYELTKIDPNREVFRARLDRARGVERKLPELLSVTTADVGVREERTGIEKFTWWDSDGSITLKIPHTSLCDDVRWNDIALKYGDRSLLIEIPKATSSAIAKREFVLKIDRLYGAIVPDKCTHIVTDECILLMLVKLNDAMRWPNLEAPYVKALPANTSTEMTRASHSSIDLRALRTEMIAKREGKLISMMNWLNKKPFKDDKSELEAMAADVALMRVASQFECGDYVEALTTITRGLRHSNISPADQLELLNYRAYANIQLGSLKDAISDYSEMFEIKPNADTLFKRATAHEQREDYEAALLDYEAALKFDMANANIRQAIRRARELVTQNNRMKAVDSQRREKDDGERSVPRPCMRQFEIRGKAGACF